MVSQVTVGMAEAPVRACVRATAWLPSLPPDDAWDYAPGMSSFIIVINSLVAYWTCRLAALGMGAVLVDGRRSRRSPSPLLMGFFIMIIVSADLPVATAIALMPLVTRFSHALNHLGRVRPLGVTSPRARVVTHLAGSTPTGGDLLPRALSYCSPVDASAADGLTREQPPRLERVAM